MPAVNVNTNVKATAVILGGTGLIGEYPHTLIVPTHALTSPQACSSPSAS